MKTNPVPTQKRKEFYDAVKCLLVFSILATVTLFAAGLISSPILRFVLLLTTGWLTWTFIEYFLHRFWMHNHFRNVNSKLYELHMNHHKHPREIKVNEVHRTLLLLIGLFLTYFAIVWNNYFTLFLGFYFGGTLYSFLHIMLHKRWGRYIFPNVQKAHIHHHGKYPDKGFSFSTIIWDWMFGTLPPKEEVISEKMLRFYFKPDHNHDVQK
jgi:sterol desaturase/sphingolipid hydroxylase (fatty acid hydroxylase superfamily)